MTIAKKEIKNIYRQTLKKKSREHHTKTLYRTHTFFKMPTTDMMVAAVATTGSKI